MDAIELKKKIESIKTEFDGGDIATDMSNSEETGLPAITSEQEQSIRTIVTSPMSLTKQDITNLQSLNPVQRAFYLPTELVVNISKDVPNLLQNLGINSSSQIDSQIEIEQGAAQDYISQFLDNPYVTQNFGAKTFSFYGKNGHEGTDFRASVGTNLYGIKGWNVVYAGQGESYYGNKVVLQNPETGEMLEFAHLKDVNVKEGDVVPSDKYIIGHTGNSGSRPDGQSQQAHLHVNYYTADGKKADVTALGGLAKIPNNVSDKAGAIPTVKSMLEKVATKLNPVKSVQAAEQQATIQNQQIQTQPATQLTSPTIYQDTGSQNKITNMAQSLATSQKQAFNSGATSNATQNKVTQQKPYTGNGYLIKSGDTLSQIARDLGVTVGTLMAKNSISDPNKIYSGSVLKY